MGEKSCIPPPKGFWKERSKLEEEEEEGNMPNIIVKN
jgi:hypothetical protein